MKSSNELSSCEVSIGTSVEIVGILRQGPGGGERTILLLLLRATRFLLSVIFRLVFALMESCLADIFGGGTILPTLIFFFRVVLLAATSCICRMGLLSELFDVRVELGPS